MNDTEETKQCSNCKLDILSSNYTVHLVHCQRNIYLCSKCQLPVNYINKLQHDEENHVVTQCKNCYLELEKCKLKDHLANECSYRKIKCQICNIEVGATEIAEHENYCGSRTEKCPECGEFVMLRYKTLHIDSNHTFIKLSDEPGPSPSWQYGRRTLHNFLPDLTSKNFKPSSNHKRRSSGKLKTTDVSKSKCSEWFDKETQSSLSSSSSSTSIKANENKDSEISKETFKPIEFTKPYSNDEWSTLYKLKSLQISDNNEETSISSGPRLSSPQDPDSESDLLHAVQISQGLNQDWIKNCITPDDKTYKNSFGDKKYKKNMFTYNGMRTSESESISHKNKFEDDFFSNNFENDSFELQEAELPCEFCGSLIVSHDLILHQSRCSLFGRDSYNIRNSSYKFSSYGKDVEKKIACGVCNKFFRLSALENHQMYCQKNLTKSWKSQDKKNYGRNVKSFSVKPEAGIQNGVEDSSPRVSRMGTRSEWLTDISKNSSKERNDLSNNLSNPETGVVKKVSRKSRRAPSPPV